MILTAGTNIAWGPREAAEAGAAAFLVKQLSDFPLVETIRSVADRRRHR